MVVCINSRIRGFVGQNPCENNSPTGSLVINTVFLCRTSVGHLSGILVYGSRACVGRVGLCFFRVGGVCMGRAWLILRVFGEYETMS